MAREKEPEVLEIGAGSRQIEVTRHAGGSPQFVFVTFDTVRMEGVACALNVRQTRKLVKWLNERLPKPRAKKPEKKRELRCNQCDAPSLGFEEDECECGGDFVETGS